MTDFIQKQRMEGRLAVVTGAARGIGRATALALGQFGATVVVSDSDLDAARVTVENLKKENIEASAIRLDVSDERSVVDAFAEVVADYGRPDILVANAGTGARQPAETMAAEDWRRVVATNLDGTFYCCREAGRAMIEGGSGAIVIVASIMGLVGGGLYPNAAYQTTKGGLVNMTRTLALEWAAKGIRVNAVAPTFARTQLTERLLVRRRHGAEPY